MHRGRAARRGASGSMLVGIWGSLSRLRTTTTLHLMAYTELSIIARESAAFHFAARASLSSSAAGMRAAVGTIDKIVKHEAYIFSMCLLTTFMLERLNFNAHSIP